MYISPSANFLLSVREDKEYEYSPSILEVEERRARGFYKKPRYNKAVRSKTFIAYNTLISELDCDIYTVDEISTLDLKEMEKEVNSETKINVSKDSNAVEESINEKFSNKNFSEKSEKDSKSSASDNSDNQLSQDEEIGSSTQDKSSANSSPNVEDTETNIKQPSSELLTNSITIKTTPIDKSEENTEEKNNTIESDSQPITRIDVDGLAFIFRNNKIISSIKKECRNNIEIKVTSKSNETHKKEINSRMSNINRYKVYLYSKYTIEKDTELILSPEVGKCMCSKKEYCLR